MDMRRFGVPASMSYAQENETGYQAPKNHYLGGEKQPYRELGGRNVLNRVAVAKPCGNLNVGRFFHLIASTPHRCGPSTLARSGSRLQAGRGHDPADLFGLRVPVELGARRAVLVRPALHARRALEILVRR